MAPRWLPIILALEIESAGWQAHSSIGDTQAYPRDEHCQSSVGSASDPWRTPQARRRYRTDQRGQVHGQATRPAVPRLEDIPPQSAAFVLYTTFNHIGEFAVKESFCLVTQAIADTHELFLIKDSVSKKQIIGCSRRYRDAYLTST